jgi:hypothetical protein
VGLRKQIQQLSWSRLASVLARLDFATCHHAVLDDGANQIAAAAAFYKSNLYLVIPPAQSLEVKCGQRCERFKPWLTDFHLHWSHELGQDSLLFRRPSHVHVVMP